MELGQAGSAGDIEAIGINTMKIRLTLPPPSFADAAKRQCPERAAAITDQCQRHLIPFPFTQFT